MLLTAQFLAINTALEMASLGEILEVLSKSCAIVIAFSRVVGDRYLISGKVIILSINVELVLMFDECVALNNKNLCQDFSQLNVIPMEIIYALLKNDLKKNPQLKEGDFFKFLFLI